MSHSTVAHRWFHQIGNKRTNENFYQSGNMFYNNKIIYSYGKHFALGIRFQDKVVINSKSYSNSTSKHFGHTLSSIDSFTHSKLYLPLNEDYRINDDIEFKNVYKHIDFKDFVYDFNHNVEKLRNARKPYLYTNKIDLLQAQLKTIFKTFRGSKTFALKTKGIRAVLNFEFTEDLKLKLEKSYKKEIEAKKRKEIKLKKEALKNIDDWLNLDCLTLNYKSLQYCSTNTLIRVNKEVIETSKGMKIDLNDGLRVLNLWKNNKAIGVEIKTKDGNTWKCSKANGLIKFGCHEIDFNQANKALKNYL